MGWFAAGLLWCLGGGLVWGLTGMMVVRLYMGVSGV